MTWTGTIRSLTRDSERSHHAAHANQAERARRRAGGGGDGRRRRRRRADRHQPRAGRGRGPVHAQERADRGRRLRAGHHLQPDAAEPGLRAHRHRRRLPPRPRHQPLDPAAGLGRPGQLGLQRRRQPRHRRRSTRTRCTWPPACTPTAGTRTTARSCAPPTRAPPGRAPQLPFKLGGNMPGRGMGERLAIDPNKNCDPVPRRPERQRPVAQHRLRRHLGEGDRLPEPGQLRAGPERRQRLPRPTTRASSG